MSLLTCQLLVCLGAAHVLGEFLFQTERTAQGKRKPKILFLHALAVAVLGYVLCGAWKTWLIPIGVLIAHCLVDAIKARVPRQSATSFLLEQLSHSAAILVIAIAAARQDPSLYGLALLGAGYLKSLIVLAGMAVTVFAGGILIGLAVEPLLAELKAEAGRDERFPPESRGFKRGGKLIGWLERALIFLFVLTGQPSSIGFLIAAKSIFRFGELKEGRNRMEADYIIIGSMMSFGFGLLVAYGTKSLIELNWT